MQHKEMTTVGGYEMTDAELDGVSAGEGGAGFDFVQVNGSNTAGDVSVDPRRGRSHDVNGQGGSDVIIG